MGIKIAVFAVKLMFAAILMKDRKDTVKLWSAVSLFCAALFEITEWMRRFWTPAAVSAGWHTLAAVLDGAYPVLVLAQETGIPYAFLLAGIAYFGVGKASRRAAALLLLAAPAATAFALSGDGLDLERHYFLVWTSVYLISAFVLMTAGLPGRRSGRPRNKRIAEWLIIVPNIVALLLLHYGAPYLRDWQQWQDTILTITTVTFALFLVVISRSGMLGIKLRLEKQVAEGTFRSVTAGTALLNHSIKNRLANIDLLAADILAKSGGSGEDAIREDVGLIHAETRQLTEMIRRIQHRTEPIVLNEQPFGLTALVREAAEACAHYGGGRADILLELGGDWTLYGDRVHLQEMTVNLLHNAIDALPAQGGTVRIAAEQTGAGLRLEIRDNGAGIPAEDLTKVLEPFYSTKDRTRNFGLGLTYCYMVAEKHGGAIQLQSEQGRGTTVSVALPSRRIVRKPGKAAEGAAQTAPTAPTAPTVTG